MTIFRTSRLTSTRVIDMASTRYESSVTAISWIPSEAIEGLSRVLFELGLTHFRHTVGVD
jgi:hypothetical protein